MILIPTTRTTTASPITLNPGIVGLLLHQSTGVVTQLPTVQQTTSNVSQPVPLTGTPTITPATTNTNPVIMPTTTTTATDTTTTATTPTTSATTSPIYQQWWFYVAIAVVALGGWYAFKKFGK